MRQGMGHTAVSATQALLSDPIDLATWSQRQLLQLFKFLTGMSTHKQAKLSLGPSNSWPPRSKMIMFQLKL